MALKRVEILCSKQARPPARNLLFRTAALRKLFNVWLEDVACPSEEGACFERFTGGNGLGAILDLVHFGAAREI